MSTGTQVSASHEERDRTDDSEDERTQQLDPQHEPRRRRVRHVREIAVFINQTAIFHTKTLSISGAKGTDDVDPVNGRAHQRQNRGLRHTL